MSARKPDRYRRVRARIRKADRYRMKGGARRDFINRVKTACFAGGRS